MKIQGPSSAAAFMIDEETEREGAEQKKRDNKKDKDGQGQGNVDLPKVDKKVGFRFIDFYIRGRQQNWIGRIFF